MATEKVNILKPSMHVFGSACSLFLCFQGLIVTNLSLFILAGFGTAHDKSQTTPTFSPSTHHTFVPNIDTAVCDANLQAGKGQ